MLLARGIPSSASNDLLSKLKVFLADNSFMRDVYKRQVHVCAQDGAACVATQRLTDDKQVAAVLCAGNERR